MLLCPICVISMLKFLLMYFVFYCELFVSSFISVHFFLWTLITAGFYEPSFTMVNYWSTVLHHTTFRQVCLHVAVLLLASPTLDRVFSLKSLVRSLVKISKNPNKVKLGYE